MGAQFHIDQISLTTESKTYTFAFNSHCFIIDGPVGTGKSSLLELVKYATGGKAVLTPVIRSEVSAVSLRVRLANSPLILWRSLGRDGGSVSVTNLQTSNATQSLYPVRAKGDEPSISDILLEYLGIPKVYIPRARTNATSASVPLTFQDLYSYLYVEQQEIDRSVVHHTESFREPKRRAIFELMFGLANPEQLAAETELGRVKDAIKHARQRADNVSGLLEVANVEDEMSLRRRENDLEIDASEAEARLSTLREDVYNATETHEKIRMGMHHAEKQANELSSRVAAAEAEIAQRRRLLSQLELDTLRADRSRTAGLQLGPLEFVVCPRCMQDIDESRAQPDHCVLCLQSTGAEDPSDDETDYEIESDERVHETRRLLELAEQDAAEGRHALAAADARVNERRAEFDRATAAAVTPRFQEIEYLSAQRARARAEQSSLRQTLAFWGELRSLQEQVASLQTRQRELQETIDSISERLSSRQQILQGMSERFDETVRMLGVPWAESASIDPKTYLPLINGERFENLAVAGGTKTIVTVAYHLTLLSWTLTEPGSLLPQILLIDTPRKNLGNNENDRDMGLRIYRRIETLVRAYQERVQFIVADNDLPSKQDWIRAMHVDYENPLIPHVLHPGEEAALSGQLETVGARQ